MHTGTHMRATWYKNNFLNKTDEIIKPLIKKKITWHFIQMKN